MPETNSGFDVTENEIRYRIQQPDLFNPESFRMKPMADGISLVLAKKSGSDSMEVQAIRFDKTVFDIDQATAWIEDHRDVFSQKEPETFNIDDVEIFACGEWNGDAYTVKDLDQIVEGFKETKREMRPYLKLGHDGEQQLAVVSGMPSLGWIDDVKRVGKKLFANFKNVPKKIYELMKRQAYARQSCEIYWDFKIRNKTYPRLLKAVALLGGETPAVHTLDDILSLYVADGDVAVFDQADKSVKIYTMERTDNQMDKKQQEALEADIADKTKQLAEAVAKVTDLETKSAESEKRVAELTEQVAKLTAERDAIVKENTDMKTKVDAIEQEAKKASEEKRLSELNAKVDKLVADKKIVPAQRDHLFAILNSITVEKKYTIGDKEMGMDEIVSAFVDQNVISVNTDQQSDAGRRQSQDLSERAKQYQAEHPNASFKDALIAIEKMDKERSAVGK